MIVLIDNYDSFVFDLARYFERLGQQTLVLRNDAITPSQIAAIKPRAIVISPGPCTPNEAGRSVPAIHELAETIPILGICLGHQAIGRRVRRRRASGRSPCTAATSQVQHGGQRLPGRRRRSWHAATIL